MKRDLKLVKTILSLIESSKTEGLLYDPVKYPYLELGEEYNKNLVDYHLAIMEEAGLISIKYQTPKNEIRLTWQGHDYLEHLKYESQDDES
ncbi:hypothetical protein NIES37_04240 [Tolypothrix tenuis PCC 7101]|uniref:DUF2513 domain-containing protein n=1 Tax=Tolypothrix tenuis PCC 7101 TaxID=231146 RepID=A0A1Z4MSW1_9CYAN|nr:DUF2513 domain-containing protein [Aulosira sp. FACHB-113]BAY96491.1 hypothetical protein NIES37_04240 [Tolypothrix tenuis PCC 7101]BAZ73003.1 hypothetical protein NIES50_15610 [Aulosira laxa NIES-50]